ncbi:hypothetical protein ABIC09_003490 [Bradyrhizobium sp. S3.12.5]|uniref:hypothetical protein n=1 Tax=Bradyrhizobium sp. S3.12.5 TaxID=3156386 RepID=UPI003394D217
MERSQPESIGVLSLIDYWNRQANASVGDVTECLMPWQMPPWDEICFCLQWEYYLLEGGSFSSRTHGSPGVYRLIGLDADSDLSRISTFNRLCGQHTSGTLYIGEASGLAGRLNQLRRTAALRTERSHGVISSLQSIWRLNYPATRLGVALLLTGGNTRSIERDLILAYINTFGDTPPLNYRFSL